MSPLERLAAALREAPGVRSKLAIRPLAAAFGNEATAHWTRPRQVIRNGDDTAAIIDGEGYLLFASEGIVSEFIEQDPWFAGFCSILVNVNDIAAMGGLPYAVTNVLCAGAKVDQTRLLQGMRDASAAFGVPIVGGHTGRSQAETLLAVSIVGRAQHLLASFDARPGDALVAVVDLRGTYRGRYAHFNAATSATSEQLRSNLQLMSQIAAAGLAHTAKDVSQASWAGTLAMLCETSGVGAGLEVNAIPKPAGVDLFKWLTTFPSFGFLLGTSESKVEGLCGHLRSAGLAAARVGSFDASGTVTLTDGAQRAAFWNVQLEALTGMGNGAAPLQLARVEGEVQ